MFRPNYYSLHEIIEYKMVKGTDGVWYASAYQIVGARKCINGHEVKDDGTPKPKDKTI